MYADQLKWNHTSRIWLFSQGFMISCLHNQLTRLASPSTDLSYYLMTSTSQMVRDDWPNLLNFYFTELKKQVEHLATPFPFTFEVRTYYYCDWKYFKCFNAIHNTFTLSHNLIFYVCMWYEYVCIILGPSKRLLCKVQVWILQRSFCLFGN